MNCEKMQVEQESVYTSEINLLRSSITSLGGKIRLLFDRINPILLPDYPKDKPECMDKSKDGSPIIYDIRKLTYEINDLSNFIE